MTRKVDMANSLWPCLQLVSSALCVHSLRCASPPALSVVVLVLLCSSNSLSPCARSPLVLLAIRDGSVLFAASSHSAAAARLFFTPCSCSCSSRPISRRTCSARFFARSLPLHCYESLEFLASVAAIAREVSGLRIIALSRCLLPTTFCLRLLCECASSH